MVNSKQISKSFFDHFKPLLEEEGYQLVEVKIFTDKGQQVYRFYLDYPFGGIDLDGCEQASYFLSEALDNMDDMPENYVLEVSSPGLDRPLITDDDFRRHLNSLIEFKLYSKVNEKKNLDGYVKEIREETLLIEVEDQMMELNRKNIALAKPKIVF